MHQFAAMLLCVFACLLPVVAHADTEKTLRTLESIQPHAPEPAMDHAPPALKAKSLEFYNINTKESIWVVFWKDGAYVQEELDKLNHFLRDYRTGDIIDMDPELIMLVHRVYTKVGGKGPIEVISGFRSQKTNTMLKSIGRNVAKRSQHILGKAIDLRIPGVKLKTLRDTALKMGVGGVGYYPHNNFVHIDTGRPRFW